MEWNLAAISGRSSQDTATEKCSTSWSYSSPRTSERKARLQSIRPERLSGGGTQLGKKESWSRLRISGQLGVQRLCDLIVHPLGIAKLTSRSRQGRVNQDEVELSYSRRGPVHSRNLPEQRQETGTPWPGLNCRLICQRPSLDYRRYNYWWSWCSGTLRLSWTQWCALW